MRQASVLVAFSARNRDLCAHQHAEPRMYFGRSLPGSASFRFYTTGGAKRRDQFFSCSSDQKARFAAAWSITSTRMALKGKTTRPSSVFCRMPALSRHNVAVHSLCVAVYPACRLADCHRPCAGHGADQLPTASRSPAGTRVPAWRS
jgi:hypothetical protein